MRGILIVEDSPRRRELLESWFPSDVKPVVVTSAGTLRLNSFSSSYFSSKFGFLEVCQGADNYLASQLTGKLF